MLVLTPFSSLLALEFMSSRLQGSATLSLCGVSEPKPLSITRSDKLDYAAWSVDSVLDLVGGNTREEAARAVKPGGILVSVVSADPLPQQRSDIRSVFFYVDVTTARLNTISEMFASGTLSTQVGTVLPLDQVRVAHEMLAGAPHARGKIVLRVAG